MISDSELDPLIVLTCLMQTVAAHSIGVHFAVQAAEELAKDGISIEVINLRSIRPLDMDTVNESVMKTGHLLTVEGITLL